MFNAAKVQDFPAASAPVQVLMFRANVVPAKFESLAPDTVSEVVPAL